MLACFAGLSKNMENDYKPMYIEVDVNTIVVNGKE